MCTGHWSWNVLNAFGTITTKFDLYAISRSTRREITSNKNANFQCPSKEENEGDDWFFIPFKSLCICHWFPIKFLKRYLVFLFVACFNWSLLSYLLFCVFIIISQVSPWGFFTVEPIVCNRRLVNPHNLLTNAARIDKTISTFLCLSLRHLVQNKQIVKVLWISTHQLLLRGKTRRFQGFFMIS